MSRPRVLFIAVNLPPEASHAGELALEQEFATIQRELLLTLYRDLELIHARAVTVDDIMRHLTEQEPLVLHFSGHGAAGPAVAAPRRGFPGRAGRGDPRTSGILLRDERDRPQFVTMRALARMISTAAPSVRLVVLNACHSDAEARALCAGVDCVISMAGAIGDAAARSFSAALYRTLGSGRSVGNAFAQAVATLDGKQFPDTALPKCRTRDGLDADLLFLAGARVHETTERTRRFARAVRPRISKLQVGGFALVIAVLIALCIGMLAYADEPITLPARPEPRKVKVRVEVEVELETIVVPADRGAPRGVEPPPSAPSQPVPKLHGSRHGKLLSSAPRSPHDGERVPAPPGTASPPAAPAVASRAAPPEPLAQHPDAPHPGNAASDPGGALGELDRSTVQRYVARHRDVIRHCYEKRLQRAPSLAGTVTVRFIIAPDGAVTSSEASGMDDEVASCVAAAIKAIEFPRSGGHIQVVTPFRFTPTAAR